jgi:hypothetical protein
MYALRVPRSTGWLGLLVAASVLSFASCSYRNIGIAGCSFALKGIAVPVLWWNGVPSTLSVIDPYHWGAATASAVEGSTSYVAGWTNNYEYYPIPAYWKSGTRVDLPTPCAQGGEASSIALSGGSVYVGGRVAYEYGMFVPVYWKDGRLVELHESVPVAGGGRRGEGYSGEVGAIAVAGGRVYCAGSQSAPEGGPSKPTLWAEGRSRELPGIEGASGGAVMAIALGVSELLLVGYATLGGEGALERPLLWEGESALALRLPEGAAGARATAVAIAGGRAFVAGWASMGSGAERPVYWEDGVPIFCELPEGYASGKANECFELGGKIYMPGWVEGRDGLRRAAYWKDGKLVGLARLEGELRSLVIGTSWSVE